MSTNPRVREETPNGFAASGAPASYKEGGAEDTGNATESKTVEGRPGQEGPRQTENRVTTYTARSHKSISRLPDSQLRMDSREEMYSVLSAWSGQSHE